MAFVAWRVRDLLLDERGRAQKPGRDVSILTKLEQMESASVILDRNDKIFGQIYVENRETVPYDQIPRESGQRGRRG